MRSYILPAIIFAGLLAAASDASAQMPRTLSFQGVLANTDGTLVADGMYAVTLRLYANAGSGGAVFTETHPSVPVVKGVLNVIIGSLTPLPPSLQFDRAYFLGISVNGGPELTPRTALTAAPYALHAAIADQARSLAPGAGGVVTSLNGSDGTVVLRGEGATTINRNGSTITISSSGGGTGIQGVQSQSGTLAVTDASGPVASLDIADAGVTTAKLADRSVTRAKLGDDVSLGIGGRAGGDLAGTYPDPFIEKNAVTSEKIANGTIIGEDVSTSARLEIATLSTSGRVGVGTDKPIAALEIRGSENVGLKIAQGAILLSYRQMRATPTMELPDSASVVRFVDNGELSYPIVTLPVGQPGQIIIISNDDAQPVSIFPGYMVEPGQTRMFVRTGEFWRMIQ